MPFLVGLVVVGVGLPILAAGFMAGDRERALQREGVVVSGTVVAKETEIVTHQKKGGGSEERTVYVIRYAFRAGKGAAVEARQPVSEATWKSLEVNRPATVRYLEEQPDVSRLEIEPLAGTTGLVSVGGVLSGIGIACVLLGAARVRR